MILVQLDIEGEIFSLSYSLLYRRMEERRTGIYGRSKGDEKKNS